MKKAVILLSGGLDSTTLAAIAKQNHELYGLTFKYGQKHDIEISFAKKNAKIFNFKEHHLIELNHQIFLLHLWLIKASKFQNLIKISLIINQFHLHMFRQEI